ncbi:MAG TPA: hypothetical protein VHL11_21140, partial [Phototrophicaceae bacterium]|nr:hypothetical protein [Phototrophicaceae bacterium]
IVSIHHGVIGVASEPGKGTTFTIQLPLFEPEKPSNSSHNEVTRPRLPALRRTSPRDVEKV